MGVTDRALRCPRKAVLERWRHSHKSFHLEVGRRHLAKLQVLILGVPPQKYRPTASGRQPRPACLFFSGVVARHPNPQDGAGDVGPQKHSLSIHEDSMPEDPGVIIVASPISTLSLTVFKPMSGGRRA